jgi:molybdopterin converting factor small subunit
MHKIEIRFFGQLTDLTKSEVIFLEDLSDTEQVKKRVLELYPALATTSFMMALNNTMIKEKMNVDSNSVIAFMPPFSGG